MFWETLGCGVEIVTSYWQCQYFNFSVADIIIFLKKKVKKKLEFECTPDLVSHIVSGNLCNGDFGKSL